MTDTSNDIDVVYTFDVNEMTREQLIDEVLSSRKQIKKWRKQRDRIKWFFRMHETDFYPTMEQVESGDWEMPPVALPTPERLESWWWQTRKFLAEEASWLGF